MGLAGSPVAGQCPMGCGPTLLYEKGEGRIRCAEVSCPNPDAVHSLLNDNDHLLHVVEFDGQGRYSIQHPLADRIQYGSDLFRCQLHRWLREYVEAHDQTPQPQGRYWARPSQKAVHEWEFIPK